MDKTIAVENNLTPISEYLAEKGYKVENIDFGQGEFTKNLDKYDAVVVTGMNENFLGVHDTVTKAPVINAKGMTKEDVYNEISSRAKQ